MDDDVVLVSYTPVINLADNEESDFLTKSKKIHSTKETAERQVKLKTIGNKQTLIVTQKVPQPTFKCIIHLNANLYDFKQKSHSECKRKTKNIKTPNVSKEPSKNEERIIPVCFRSNYCCKNVRNMKFNTSSHSIKSDKMSKHKKCESHKYRKHRKDMIGSREDTKGQKQRKTSRIDIKKLKKKSKHDSKRKWERSGTPQSFSLSSEPNNNCINSIDSYYEDISDNSFYLESEIDLLIKRTKERTKLVRPDTDTKLSPVFEAKQYVKQILTPELFDRTGATSTPNDFDDNATVFSSDMDVSIHSLTTVVLNPRTEMDTKYFQPISPTPCEYSRIKTEEKLLKPQDKVMFSTSHQKGNVKHENLVLEEKCCFDNQRTMHKTEYENESKITHEIIDNNCHEKKWMVKHYDIVDIKNEPCELPRTLQKRIDDNREENLVGIVKDDHIFDIKNEPYSPTQTVY